MAGRGPAPKPQEQRRRRNVDPVGTTRLVDDGQKRGEPLDVLTGRDWPQAVVAWWETWRSSPQSQAFLPTDWQRLAMLAPIVEAHFEAPSPKYLSEIRLNEERMGATVVDRQRARMSVEAAESADVLPLRSMRDEISRRLARGEDKHEGDHDGP
jgi:hypothetical protein